MDHDIEARILGEFSGIVRRGRVLEAASSPADEVPASAISVLALLADGGEQRMGAVAAALGLDTSVVSRTVAGAAALGLVARRPDPRDGRACLLSLTARGAGCLTERRNRRLRLIGTVVDGWEPGSAEVLLDGLTRLRTGLAQLPLPPSPDNRPVNPAADTAKDNA